MTKRGLSVAVSWHDEPKDTKVLGITYGGKALPLPLTRAQAAVKKKLGKLWDIPIKDWPRKKKKR